MLGKHTLLGSFMIYGKYPGRGPNGIVVDKQGKITVNNSWWYDIRDIKGQLNKL